MGLLLFLAFSLLLQRTSSLMDVPHSSCSTKFEGDHRSNSSGLHLTLHHPRSPCSPATLHHLPFSTVLSHDDSRAQFLAARLTKTTPRPKSALLDPDDATIPVNSGMSIGDGNYITRIGLGTPSNSYIMVVDTGSSLIWLQCSPCRVSCHKQVGAVFNPAASSTYRSVSCSEPECKGLQSATSNPSNCTTSNVCIYNATYGDGSFSVGNLGKDSLSLGSAGRVLPNLVFGCGQDNEGLFGKSAGLVGLARNKLSLTSQLAPKLGNAFSYCLPTTASTGYATIGSYPPAQYEYTPMVSSSLDDSLYFVRLTRITVGGKRLAVVPSAYTSTPTIMDSGTVITRLPPDVYSALSKAVVAALRGHARAPASSKILDTCYKGSAKGLAVPEVDIVFQGGAKLRLPARNVMVDLDSSTTCLAFARAGRVAIIGNTQQQTFRVAYDVARSRIGFAAGGCG